MHNNLKGWLGIAAVAMLAGCAPPALLPSGSSAGTPVRLSFAQIFDHEFNAPSRMTDLHGLALYNTAIEPQGDGTPRFVVYALINNRNPLQGILVGSHTPLSLSFFRERRNASTIVSGSLNTFQGNDLPKYYKEHHGIELAVNSQGQPLWIDGVEAPTAVPAAASSSTPPPPASGPAQSPPPEQNDENAPYDRELVFVPYSP